ncbi:MAG: 3-methyl-2-oxobutanoate hydroxymethyltransferase [Nitrospiraceae bacterium]|nr:3-methyl-2-oxobutanoate hydroxymethyltransferase [Nitrospiraceae bacterium]
MPFTVNDFFKKKQAGEKIAMITAYDFCSAAMAQEAGIDVLLVGDSLGMVVQGLENTLPVTMDEMIYHTKMVSRAAKGAFVIADMPYMSYQVSVEQAVANAGRFLKEVGAHAVKLEGGRESADKVKAIVAADIPVMAHIGLTPQSIHRMGGFKVQGKTGESARILMEDARILQDAGAFSIVLEAIPAALAAEITAAFSIPTIGIGAGPGCDGQVLVIHDVLGMFDRFVPKFVKRYADLKKDGVKALSEYRQEVEKGIFPSSENSF